MEEEYEEAGGVPLQVSKPRGRHIKKRALKNKALSVSFNEKDLRDYVTGFHKRKKKRRKEAQKQQEEAERRKRIEQRKKRKLEKEFVLFGGAPPSTEAGPDGSDENNEDEEREPTASVSGTTMYDNGNMTVTVTTSEITREAENLTSEKTDIAIRKPVGDGVDSKHKLPIREMDKEEISKFNDLNMTFPITHVSNQFSRQPNKSSSRMQTRYMERSNNMAAREKRGLDSSSGDEGPDRKRPALASVIVEALKVDSLQKLCSSLEPILRRVVSEEVERALAKLGPAKLAVRSTSSPKRLEGPDGRNLQLHFRSRLSLPLFTGGKVEGEQGAAIHIVLIDANTGHVVTSGPESSAKLDVIVLEGDFNNEDDDNWTQEEFDSHVVKEREGKRPLLTGELQVMLKDGVGTLGELTFTDNSSWIRSRKFRLGLKVASGSCEGIRIREAKTDAFTVKDHRGELYKKHYPPALNDEVWRLEKIGKDGSFHKRLNKAGIFTVEDFLRLVVRDSQRLRNILGSGMSNKMWDVLVEHAKTCVLGGKLYVYYPDDIRSVGIVFNNIYELSGLIANGEYYAADSLSDNQKVYVDALVKKAYENWMHVIEYDGKTLLDCKEEESAGASQANVPVDPQGYPSSINHQQTLPTLSVPVPPDQHPMDSGLNIGGYDDSMAARLSMHSQNVHLNAQTQLNGASFTLQNPLVSASQQVQLPQHDNEPALGPSQSSMPSFNGVGTSNIPTYKGMDDFFSEEEIRMRSHEMLENDDMQHLLRIFNMESQAHTPFNATGGGYGYSSSYMPTPSLNYGFDNETSRSSGKAVVGWLKLKAALRWGIFIRKKAAERRAHLVELDDS
ncbi:Calmodulin binding protein-like protein [Corchorus olitorius]|uniref:Calmodulin binding protein-like protein n=1 Tax=Corchorus olitorius TaxID=93759 RepID=A0A1R3H429_9ROSI|nr:Calmodulin binding protein-like protein [Corchorus olitorius]